MSTKPAKQAAPRTRMMMAVAAVLVLALAGWQFLRPTPVVNANPSGRNIIAFGDSLTAGGGAGRGEDYVSQLSRMAGVPILNKGVSGDTSGQGLARLERDVLAHDPRIVIVCLGGNDILQRIPSETTFANLEQIVTRIQAAGALVVLVGVDGGFLLGTHGEDFRALARRTGAVFVPNVLKGILDNPRLKADQIHPNGAGYTVMAERIHAKLEPYLEGGGAR